MAVLARLANDASALSSLCTRYSFYFMIALVPFICFLVYLIHRDFRAFRALGPGGTPSNFVGYLKIKLLSCCAISDPYMPAAVPPLLEPQSGYLKYLPPRVGPRPNVEGIAPQRQTNQRPTPEAFQHLCRAVYDLAEAHPSLLKRGTSCLERHGPGLFTLSPMLEVIKRTGARNCSGEICHSHPSDGSTHLTLHPADAAILLQSGWGERHPLAKGGWWSRFVPAGFLMVYAPRSEAEVETVKTVIEAAVWWVGGIDIGADGGEKSKAMRKEAVSGDRMTAQAVCQHCGR